MDAARREELLRAYDGHVLRFNAGTFRRHGTAGIFPRSETAVPQNGAESVLQRETDALTGRQQEVLALVGEGLSNDEICAKLHITVETVKSHVQHILRGLGARNRAHAVSLGHRHGIL